MRLVLDEPDNDFLEARCGENDEVVTCSTLAFEFAGYGVVGGRCSRVGRVGLFARERSLGAWWL